MDGSVRVRLSLKWVALVERYLKGTGVEGDFERGRGYYVTSLALDLDVSIGCSFL